MGSVSSSVRALIGYLETTAPPIGVRKIDGLPGASEKI